MRERVARGRKVAVVARVMKVSRQALYRTPKRRPAAQKRPATGMVDRAIVEVAKANPTDGTRMVAALTSRELKRPVSRKRPAGDALRAPASAPPALRSPASSRLLQRAAPRSALAHGHDERLGRREWLCYLTPIVDYCTREIADPTLSLVERGNANPTWATVRDLAAALGVSMGQLAKLADKFSAGEK